ncbi:MAG: DNA polymerase II [Gammaproteobacteria bacterium]|nr:DNA polymerase II [Gammaproteobacteria bacterium]
MAQRFGFLLTRHWRDAPEGIELSFWIHTDQGPLRARIPHQEAVCFIPRQTKLHPGSYPGISFRRVPLELVNLQAQEMDGLYFRHQRHLKQLRHARKGGGFQLYESDIKPTDRYLMERFVTATVSVTGELLEGSTCLEMIHPRLSPGTFEPRLRYLSLDIETDAICGETLSIALCGQGKERILMQGQASDWPSDLPIRWFKDEPSLLRGLLTVIADLDPDLILGWNVVDFDLVHIEKRCRYHRIPFQLGRGNESAAILQPRQPGQKSVPSIPGRVVLDGIDSLRSAFWSFDNFSLEHVAHKLLGKGKLIDESEDKVQAIRNLFKKNRPALADYNLQDCRLVEEIFQQTDLINFAVQRALMTGIPLGRTGGSVAAFDNLYLPRLHRRGAVAHDVGNQSFTTTSPGGYVMDSQPGLYENVLVLDFKSLYPSIIRTFHIDPLGMAKPGADPIPGFLDACFSRQKSILPELIAELWRKRDLAKKAGDQSLSQATKIIMNSFYGVLGSSGCRFYNPALASSITRRGHQIITSSRDWLEKQGYRIIYGDTDSLFVLLGPDHSENQATTTGKHLAQSLNDWWSERIRREFRMESFLEVEYETHFLRFLMPTTRGTETGSKKRYAGSVRMPGGKFQVVFKGLESVRSDWTPLARAFQQELYQRVFFDKPYQSYVKDISERLKRGELDHQLVYRKRLRKKLDSYRKNVPPHVQAARKSSTPGRWVNYLITINGPEPLDNTHSPIDYQHYLTRQLAPAADGLLHFLNSSFQQLTADQLDLF